MRPKAFVIPRAPRFKVPLYLFLLLLVAVLVFVNSSKCLSSSSFGNELHRHVNGKQLPPRRRGFLGAKDVPDRWMPMIDVHSSFDAEGGFRDDEKESNDASNPHPHGTGASETTSEKEKLSSDDQLTNVDGKTVGNVSDLSFRHYGAQRFVKASDGSTVTMLAVLSRYADDLTWLTHVDESLVQTNASGDPEFIIPFELYQACDIGPGGLPEFPGKENYTVPEAGWPEWAWEWVHQRNITKSQVPVGGFEEANLIVRDSIGLPQGHTSPSWKDWEDIDRRMNAHGGILLRNNHTRLDLGNQTVYEQLKKECLPPGSSSTVTVPNITVAIPFHLVPNRGAEAMAYLSSIIKHYDALPDFMLFMHSHRRAWHTPLPQDWNLRRLVTHPPKDLPSENGYMPLACYERWGSDISQIWPTVIDANAASPNGERWHMALAARFVQAWREHFTPVFGGREVPDYVRLPPAATFIVTKQAIQRHDKDFYIKTRDWMLKTLMHSKDLGVVLEFMWGIIFANKTYVNPSQEKCLCELYSICTLPADV